MFIQRYDVLILIWTLSINKCYSDSGHCIITAVSKTVPSPRKIIPEISNATECSKIEDNLSTLDISLCPDSRYIRFKVTIDETKQETTLYLCYDIRTVYNWKSLSRYCYRIPLSSLEKSQLDCWFPMEYIQKRPTITASFDIISDDICRSSYAELNTGTIDIENSCTNKCDTLSTRVQNIVSCDRRVRISHDQNTIIILVTFTSLINTAWTDSKMEATKQDGGSTEYIISSNVTGQGYILITYVQNEEYCQRKHDVIILCSTGSINVDLTTDVPVTQATFWKQHSNKLYVALSVVSILVIIGIVTTIVFTRVRKRRKERKQTDQDLRVSYRATSDDKMHQSQPLIAVR